MAQMTINQTMLKAVEVFKSGDVAAAKRLLSKIIQIEFNHPDANSNMGAILVASGDLEEALPFIKTALEANFSVAQHWFNYIDVLFRLNKFSQASELLEIAKGKGCKGQAFDELEEKLSSTEVELKKRIQRLQDADWSGPKGHLLPFGLGEALQELGELEEAIEAYKKALAIKPDYASAYNNMGLALNDQGKQEEAIEAYNKAIAIKPDYAEAYSNIGIVLADQGKIEEAMEAYKKALSLKSDYARAAINLVKTPLGRIDNKTVVSLDQNLSLLCAAIEDQSQRLFFEANVLSHNGKYADAFKVFVEANRIKWKSVAPSVKNLEHDYDVTIKRIKNWAPKSQYKTDSSIKKLFLLGPSRSGKSTLEHLLAAHPNVFPMFENINLNSMNEPESLTVNPKKLSMAKLFYCDDENLLGSEYEVVTSTSPESIFHIDGLIDGLANSFCVFVKRDRADIASEIFTREYKSGNFYSYNNLNILKYLDTYDAMWQIINQKIPHRTLEVSFKNILTKPQEVLERISKLTATSCLVESTYDCSIKNLESPFKKHYKAKFMPK